MIGVLPGWRVCYAVYVSEVVCIGVVSIDVGCWCGCIATLHSELVGPSIPTIQTQLILHLITNMSDIRLIKFALKQ